MTSSETVNDEPARGLRGTTRSVEGTSVLGRYRGTAETSVVMPAVHGDSVEERTKKLSNVPNASASAVPNPPPTIFPLASRRTSPITAACIILGERLSNTCPATPASVDGFG